MLALLVGAGTLTSGAGSATLPSGFTETSVWSGLTNPMAVRFASDGRVFVAEKSGRILVFDSLSDPSPTLFADLSTNVYNFWDRGLMGLALDPSFPAKPYVYVLYTYDAVIGGLAPRWGTPGVLSDPCPTPPGPTSDGCVVSGRLSRLQAAGNVMTGSEQVLIEDWCQQYPSHSVGALAFGPDGALYASGGDGASFTFADYGQDGNPLNPCGDPPVPVGGTQTPPTAEGGSLRSQDLRTSADPAGLDGTIIRVNPDTGQGLPDNPLAFSSDANARRVVAYGLRNPFRFAFRPGTSEVWLGDVGLGTWEELNRIPTPADTVADNFGWPCYEGVPKGGGFTGYLNICENLFAEGTAVSPYYAYNHSEKVVPGEACPTGGSSVSGTAFYTTGTYPASYQGALFQADYTRKCIWVFPKGADGLPNPAARATFVANAGGPVDLQTGPGGDLFYADFDGGTIRRITYAAASGEDKALGKPASASSVEKAGLEPGKANDGDSTTRWSSIFADNQWWQVDLGSNRQVDKVELNWEVAYASRYQIQTSLDGSTFTLAADETISAPGLRTSSFSARSARYVRVLCLTRATSYGCSFWDARVFGPSDTGPPPDTTPPTVAITAPSPGATVSGTLNVTANASDNVAVASVQFKLDGANLGPADTSPPYSTSWNTTTTANGNHTLTATATDTAGNPTTSASVGVDVQNGGPPNTPPQATIQTPPSTLTWSVADAIAFSGTATDDGPLPPSAYSWTLTMEHCPSNCHSHVIQTFAGVTSGSFSAPDHDYPSHLQLRLTVTDAGGLTDVETVAIQPKTAVLNFTSSPSGAQLVVGSQSQATPFSRTVIAGSNNSLGAPSPQTVGGQTYAFSSWSDGGAANHNIIAPAAGATYQAFFQLTQAPSLVAAYSFNEASGVAVNDASTFGNRGTISGATRTAAGRFGRALSFDGLNDSVTVPDASSLDLSTAMTLEGWVFPTVMGSTGLPLIHKENADGHSVYDVYANSGLLRPSADALVSPRTTVVGSSQLVANTWTHLAATYDGASVKLYVNGTLVGTAAASGSIAQSAGALRIGAANILRTWFRGRIDEVRIYSRALSAQEIGTDMNTPISP